MTKISILLLAVLGSSLLATAARADDELYKTKNCFACHRVERNHLGPSFRAIATRYADDKEAATRLALKVREGTVGAWGQVPMPPQPQVTEAEAATLVRWILEQR